MTAPSLGSSIAQFQTAQYLARPSGCIPRHLSNTPNAPETVTLTPEEKTSINNERLALIVANVGCESLKQEQKDLLNERKRVAQFYRALGNPQLNLLKLLPGRVIHALDRLECPWLQPSIECVKKGLLEMQTALFYYQKDGKEEHFKKAQEIMSTTILPAHKLLCATFANEMEFNRASEIILLFDNYLKKRSNLFPLLLRPMAYDPAHLSEDIKKQTRSFLHPDYLVYIDEAIAGMRAAIQVSLERLEAAFKKDVALTLVLKNKKAAFSEFCSLINGFKQEYEEHFVKREKLLDEIEVDVKELRIFAETVSQNKPLDFDFEHLSDQCSKERVKELINVQGELFAFDAKLQNLYASVRDVCQKNKELKRRIDPKELYSALRGIYLENKNCLSYQTDILGAVQNIVCLRMFREILPLALNSQEIAREEYRAIRDSGTALFSIQDVVYQKLIDCLLDLIPYGSSKLLLDLQDVRAKMIAIYSSLESNIDCLYEAAANSDFNQDILDCIESYNALKANLKDKISPELYQTVKRLIKTFLSPTIVHEKEDERPYSLSPWLLVPKMKFGSSTELSTPVLELFADCAKTSCRLIEMMAECALKISCKEDPLFSPTTKQKIDQYVDEHKKSYHDLVTDYKAVLKPIIDKEAADIGFLHVRLAEFTARLIDNLHQMKVNFQTVVETEYLNPEAEAKLEEHFQAMRDSFFYVCNTFGTILELPSRNVFLMNQRETLKSSEPSKLWLELENLPEGVVQACGQLDMLQPQKDSLSYEWQQRKRIMDQALKEIRYNYLLVLKETGKRLQNGSVSFFEVETYCQHTGLLLEALLKFALAYYDCRDDNQAHILFSRSQDKSQKLLTSEHHLELLAKPLQAHLDLSTEDLELLEQYSNVIVLFTQSLYYKAGTLGDALRKVRNGLVSLADLKPGPTNEDQFSQALDQEAYEFAEHWVQFAFNKNIESLQEKLKHGLELAHKLVEKLSEKTITMPLTVESIKRPTKAEIHPDIAIGYFSIQKRITALMQKHPLPMHLPCSTDFEYKSRLARISHSLASMRRAVRDAQVIIATPTEGYELSYAKLLLSKTALFLQEALILPLCILPMKAKDSDSHVLFDTISTFSQSRPRYHSHDLKSHFNLLNTESKLILSPQEIHAVEELSHVLGGYAGYLFSGKGTDLGDSLWELAKCRYLLNVLDLPPEQRPASRARTLIRYSKQGDPGEALLQETAKQRTKINPAIIHGLEVIEKLLLYTLSFYQPGDSHVSTEQLPL